ncbi:MAG: phosphoribosylglycinamide formyltransferase [Candidatus Saccharimonadales bacterium]
MNNRIAILASGGGTTAEAFIKAGQNGEINSQVGIVIVSRHDAGIFSRIESLNKEYGTKIGCLLINSTTHPAGNNEIVEKGHQTLLEEEAIIEVLQEGNYDLIALMGYMKKTGPKLVRKFGWRPEYTSIYQAMMVNTHPGLLPDTKAMYGLNIQSYILKSKLDYGGQTLHLVADEYDDGPIIAEHRVAIAKGETEHSLFRKVQAVEKQHLPADIDKFIKARQKFFRQKLGGKSG